MSSHYQAPAAATPDDDGNLRIWSCVNCRRRKVKCERRDPCANCVRNNIECHFPVTGRLPRRSRDPAARSSPSQRQEQLLGRLQRLEALVTELSGQLEDGVPGASQLMPVGSSRSSASASASADKTPLTAGTEMYEDFGRLVVDQGLGPRVDRGFWSIFCDEVHHIFQAIENGSDEPEPPRQDGPATAAHCHGYVLGTPCAAGAEEDLVYPLPSQVPFLWRTYVGNVDPFIKVLHTPSVEAIITQAKGKLNHHGPGVQALLFAVCLAAIVSLDEDEVSDSFRVSKSELVSCLRLRTERALGHAQFATTGDVVVVQALTIYLFILPHIGAGQLALTLTGVLVRIATSIGLHRDPLAEKSRLNLTDLDVETRRRLWWHILFLDSRGRDLSTPGGGIISEDSFTTRIPANVDDQDLAGAIEGKRLTPTTLSIIRGEIWRLRNSLCCSREHPLDFQLQKVYSARAKIEGTYLSEPTTAFASFLAGITGLFFAKIEAEICRQHLCRASDPESQIRSRFFAASVAVIEVTQDLSSNPAWDCWQWQFQGSFPWRAVGAVFIHLCQLPWTPVSERAWELARGLFEGLPDEAKREAMWRRLNELASNAGVHRRQEMEGPDATGSGWNLVQRETEERDIPTQEKPQDVPNRGHEAQVSLIGDVLAETAVSEWERNVYAVDEVLGGWLDWDTADMDMF